MTIGPEQKRTGPWRRAALAFRPRVAALALVLVVGAAVTGTFTAAAIQLERSRAERDFATEASVQTEMVEDRIQSIGSGVRSVVALFDASSFVSREEFGRFVAPLMAREGTIRSLIWAPRVSADELEVHVTAARGEGLSTYRVFDIEPDGVVSPATERAEYYPSAYAEPMIGNRALFGVDWHSIGAFSETLADARDSGELTASVPTDLPYLTLDTAVLVVAPVYEASAHPQTVEARNELLQGFVVAVVSTGKLIEITQQSVSDTLAGSAPALLVTDASAPGAPPVFNDTSRREDETVVEIPVDAWGRTWILAASPARSYGTPIGSIRPWMILLVGFALTLASWSLVRGVVERQNIAEAAARDTDARYRAIVENTVEGIITIDVHGIAQTANRAAAGMFGYEVSEILGNNVSMLMTEPDRTLHDGYLDRYLATGEARIIGSGREVTGRRKDGTTFPIDLAVSEIRSWRGEKTFTGVLRDITQPKQAEREALEREARFRNLFEAAPLGIALMNAEGAIVSANPALVSMFGFTEEESLVGRRFKDLRHPSFVYRNQNRYGRLVKGESTELRGKIEYLHSSGRPIWAETVTAPVLDATGNFLYAIRMVQDVTQRKEADVELRERELRYRSLVQSAPIGITIADTDRRIVEANGAFAEMLGYPVEQIIGKRLNAYETTRPVRSQGSNYVRLMAGEIDRVELVRELIRADGTPLSAHTITAAVRDEEGVFRYAIRLIEDITEQLRIDRMKDEFLSIVSHELRTPLTAIHGAVNLAASGALGEVNDAVRSALTIAANNSSRLGRLISDILDLERMEAGELKITLERCDAALCAQEALEAVAEVAQSASVSVELDVTPNAFSADSDRVVQVLTNLLSNAVKFSPEGSVVMLSGRREQGSVRFAVTDHGLGIPGDQQDAIFDRFRQVDATDSRLRGGSGLGLAIVRHIMRGHGGWVSVASAMGEGSTFTVEFPVAGPPSDTKDAG